ncbi:hypothetical protein [Actinoplanes philippinensis]|uniref:hypothetical protein n=1 Tax=Actinoplanes philippinensis TaxID=35752 RepID=UPI0033E07D1F
MLLAKMAIVYVFDVGLRGLIDRYPGQTAGGLLLAVAIPFLIMLINRATAVEALSRHAALRGWVAVDPAGREWPWTDLRLRGTIRVLRAWSLASEGLPITAGELKWTGNALAGAVEGMGGKGVFVIVHLPEPLP